MKDQIIFKKFSWILVLTITSIPLFSACKTSEEHAKSEHPTSEHPTSEHPTSEHPTSSATTNAPAKP